jgi:hypothetical protein
MSIEYNFGVLEYMIACLSRDSPFLPFLGTVIVVFVVDLGVD